ncbi:MAG: LamG domain-containing protein [Verrucomicrobia bacterium]|jgi:hypothetical protein|nr:LamG domain-containing protein [Verrucomicrobiota bacterium]
MLEAPGGGTLYLISDLLKSPDTRFTGIPTLTEESPFGPAVLFNGVDDQIILDETPLAGMSRFTVEVWLRPDMGGSPEPRFLHIGEVNGDRMMLEGRLTENRMWAVDSFLRAGEEYLVLLDMDLLHPAEEWCHVALVVEDGVAKNYVNGVEELEGALPFHPIDHGVVSIGARANQKHFFKGAIHSVRITPQALTPDGFTMGGLWR